MAYLNEEREEEWRRFDKPDFYLAQIAMYLVKANCKDPAKIKMDDFRPKLEAPGTEKRKKQNPKAMLNGFLTYFANRGIQVQKQKNGSTSK